MTINVKSCKLSSVGNIGVKSQHRKIGTNVTSKQKNVSFFLLTLPSISRHAFIHWLLYTRKLQKTKGKIVYIILG